MVLLTEYLPGSSSSSSTHLDDHRYDVFLSFRGVDTRNSFTDHLYNALLDAGIITFLDEEDIETGEPLKPELESAIKSSRASIIVLSKNYASSTWCLEELVLILDQKRSFNQIVIPIFYDVEPTDVRKQQNSFAEAIAKHKLRMDAESDAEKKSQSAQRMELWKTALTQVADLKGMDARDRKETELINEVVMNIHDRLGVLLSNTLPCLIGMDHYVKLICSWLNDGSGHNADILTVVGMGGIGKTSLAKYVFGLHSSKFHKSSFIEGIDTRCKEHFNGLLDLQKQLHGDISKRIPLQVNDVSVYTSKIEKALARKMVFIVLDDIGDLDQLDALLGNKGFYPGSKIIVTTKDASLTERCALFALQAQPKHTKILVNGLYMSESLELLCIHAFNSCIPKEGYQVVSEKLIKYCEGHPLALQVFGRSLQKRDVAHWEACIKGLQKEPHPSIKKVLRMSVDTLTSNDIELFKHIACFFVGKDRNISETILNACEIDTRFGITNLISRCLLNIGVDKTLTMHALIQEMGRDLVREESPHKPWKRSRLWCNEESFKVLRQEKGKGNLLGLAIDMRMLDKKKLSGSFELKTSSLSNMDNLMLLQLNYAQFNGCFENFPEELRWLCMHGFPLKSMHLDFPLEYLVSLDMSYSKIEYFDMSYSNSQPPPAKRQKQMAGTCSRDKSLLGSLKILDLSYCKQLQSVGGFSEFPALETLTLRMCISLIEVCESVEKCVELANVDLSYCYKLKQIPIFIGKFKKVKTLLLEGCNDFESEFKKWDMNSSNISINSHASSSSTLVVIPSDMKFFTTSLPSSLVILSLAHNNLSSESFPMDFSYLSMLKELCLDGNPIVSMPICVRTLPRLERLSMELCEMLVSVEHPPRTLRVLSIKNDDVHDDSLRMIKFDPEMSPLEWLKVNRKVYSFEIEGMVKIQPMAGVEEKLLRSLGWTNLDVIKERRFMTHSYDYQGIECQMYYEFGIFSTFYQGKDMPDWIRCRSKSPSISFTFPSYPKKLRGLNFCCVETSEDNSYKLPMIHIRNITKNHTWIYLHYVNSTIYLDQKGCLSLLSHWMFGPNEMECGDHISIDVYYNESLRGRQFTTECGVGLVYDEDGKYEEEEDALGYYKSWNHIIGGDLSAFQLTTGEYLLDNEDFIQKDEIGELDFLYTDDEVSYKEKEVHFKAFSKQKV